MQQLPGAGHWLLWFEYTRSDGIIGYSTIPMKRKTDPVPAGHIGPLWDFVERSPFIDCSPSVRILGPKEGAPDHFHNAGQWTIPYVIMAKPFGETIIIEGEEVDANDVLRTVNQHKTKEERDGVIFKARAQGILL